MYAKKILKYIPQLSIGIIICSVIKLTAFYSGFDIPIYQYLSLSEIGLLFTQDLLLIGITVLIALPCLILAGKHLIASKNAEESENSEESVNVKENKRLKSLDLFSKIFNSVYIALGIVCFIMIFFQDLYFSKLFLIVVSLSTITISVFSITQEINREFFIKFKIEMYLYFTGMLYLSFIVLSASLDFYKVSKGRYSGTIITTSDSTYISNESRFYVGRTSTHTFMFNRKDSSTIVIPNESIKTFILKRNKVEN